MKSRRGILKFLLKCGTRQHCIPFELGRMFFFACISKDDTCGFAPYVRGIRISASSSCLGSRPCSTSASFTDDVTSSPTPAHLPCPPPARICTNSVRQRKATMVEILGDELSQMPQTGHIVVADTQMMATEDATRTLITHSISIPTD